MMELISVIIPIYNAGEYLDRCIESVVYQQYSDLEIMLIDDGSSDDSLKICQQWACRDGRIRVVHQDNQGVSAARNVGIIQSTGKYIVMVDSDDYLSHEMIGALYRAATENQAELALCKFEMGFDDHYVFPEYSNFCVENLDAETALKESYKNGINALQYIAPWGKLYRRELFDGLQYPDGRIFEDIYITHQILFRCSKIAVLQQTHVYYFQHSESIMNQPFHEKKLDYLEALYQRIVFYKQNASLELQSIAYDEYLHALIWEYSRARDILDNKPAMKDIKKRFRASYRRGYSSKRYPDETAIFLGLFARNPEFIIMYWKVKSKLYSFIRKRGGK